MTTLAFSDAQTCLTFNPAVTRCVVSALDTYICLFLVLFTDFVMFFHPPPQQERKDLIWTHILYHTRKLFVFKWIRFFVCKAVEATIFHSSKWNPGDNQYDMPNNRTQWFEFNTLGSRITNVPVAENRSPHRSSSNWNAQGKQEWNYIKRMLTVLHVGWRHLITTKSLCRVFMVAMVWKLKMIHWLEKEMPIIKNFWLFQVVFYRVLCTK